MSLPDPSAAPQATFAGHQHASDYAAAVARFLAGDRQTPIPVWVGNRSDLTASITAANKLYRISGRRSAFDVRIVRPQRLPEALRDMLRALSAGSGDRPVLTVGLYQDLRFGDRTAGGRDQAQASGAEPSVFLTGRDVHSLTWMVAKQWAGTGDLPDDLVVTALDHQPALDGVEWVGPDDITRGDRMSILRNRPWRRVLLHGNGQDDSLNLGQNTVCGRRQGAYEPTGYGPSCHFGQGCYKPEWGLIPVGDISTGSLTLLNCFSGPSARLSTYHEDYQLLLAAVDGPARSIVVTSTACDAGRPEIRAWLGHPDGSRAAMNRSVADTNPYPVFFQCGTEEAAPSATAEIREVLPPEDSERPAASLADRIRVLSTRSMAIGKSGLLPENHPIALELGDLDRFLSAISARDALRDPDLARTHRAQCETKVAAIDARIARSLSTESAVSRFPAFFGDHSTVRPGPMKQVPPCSCGEPASVFVKVPVLAAVAAVSQTVCDRCGDIENAMVGAPELRMAGTREIRRGETARMTVRLAGTPGTVPIVGLGMRASLRAEVQPAACRVAMDRRGQGSADFELAVSPDTRAQAEYLLPFAVHDLALNLGRFHLLVRPDTK
ncbi:hypothetical protein [Streptomyces shenzhenensis]|uniref:hypothetical protein n=1 Tax=Streptomyces shenzhenensis TaxID=943815 RepID=UPI001F4145C6|nr:hypothetical protein [Streptomyces shenzhenensis]